MAVDASPYQLPGYEHTIQMKIRNLGAFLGPVHGHLSLSLNADDDGFLLSKEKIFSLGQFVTAFAARDKKCFHQVGTFGAQGVGKSKLWWPTRGGPPGNR